MYNPIGAVYRINDRFSGANAVEFSRVAEHRSTTVLDDFKTAVALKTQAGVQYSVLRVTGWEPGNLKGQTEQVIRTAASQVVTDLRNLRSQSRNPSMHYLLNNEQEWTPERMKFYTYVLEALTADPIGVVFGNFASGSVKSGQGDDPNWWKTDASEFLLVMEKYKDVTLPDGTHAFILGMHEYTSLYPWIAANGGEFFGTDWHLRSIRIDWEKPQWHLGRTIQGIRLAGLPVPWMIITETLFDRMNDVITAWKTRGYPIAGTNDPRGYHSLGEFWRSAGFPGSEGETYHDFLVWAWENIWSASDKVLAVQTYLFNDTGDWRTFDVSQDVDYLKANRSYRYGPTTTPCTGEYDVRVFESGRGAGTAVYIYRQPSTASEIVGSLVDGTQVAVNLTTRYTDPIRQNWFWYEIATSTGCGWVTDRGGTAQFVVPTEPEIPDNTVQAQLDQLAQAVERLQKEVLTKTAFQDHAEQLMVWTAENFVSKAAFLGFLKSLPDVARGILFQQNVETRDE